MDGNYGLTTGQSTWEWPQIAADAAERFYVGPPGSTAYGDGRVIRAFMNADDDTNSATSIEVGWDGAGYIAPTITVGIVSYDLRQEFESPPAVDEDGTLIFLNRGYVLALRPFAGDLNGDGEISCADASAFADALVDYESWGNEYGEPYGINVVGVGDCNNDGVFNNFDIDRFTEILCAECESWICEDEGDSGGRYAPEAEAAAQIITALRVLFDMD